MAVSRRRTQEERSTQTRISVITAAIDTIAQSGYAGASTTLIAETAGVSRGAMLHHFPTRAALMADVVRHVFEQEMLEYERLLQTSGFGNDLADWPKLLWRVLSRPPGMAVLEILQATRGDTELAAVVIPMQEAVEQAALASMRGAFGGDESQALTVMRLMVWAARGLSIADHYLPQKPETEQAIDLLCTLIRRATPDGKLADLRWSDSGTT